MIDYKLWCVLPTFQSISKSLNVSHIGLYSLYILDSYYYAVTGWSFLNKTLFAKQRVLFVFKAFVNKGFRNVFLYMLMTGKFYFRNTYLGDVLNLDSWTEFSSLY